MWASFWDWLSKLPQGSASFVGMLAGSSLGLVALLTAALVNASLNRRRDDRLREQERTALAAVLYAELAGMRRTLSENADHLMRNPPNREDGFVVPKPSARLMEDTIARLGLLGPETIRKVMDAYVLNESYLEDMILAGGQWHSPESKSLVFMPAAHAEFVVQLNRARAAVVDEAMKALRRFLKMSGVR